MLTLQMSLIHQTPLFPRRHSPMNWQAVITRAERDESGVSQEQRIVQIHTEKHTGTQTHTQDCMYTTKISIKSLDTEKKRGYTVTK